MPDPLVYMLAATCAAAAAMAAALLIERLWKVDAAGNRFAGLLALLSGAVAGGSTLPLRPAWPPYGALDRLLLIVLPLALLIEGISSLRRVPGIVGWAMRVCLAAAAGRILLHDSVYLHGEEWPWWQTVVAIGMSGLLLAGVWLSLDQLRVRWPSQAIALALAMATQAAGLAVMLAGYIKGGAAGILLAAALMGTSGAGALLGKNASLRATLGVGATGLFGVIFVGLFFGRLSLAAAITLLLAPLLCWSANLPLLRVRSAWITAVVALTIVAIPLGVVLILAKIDFDKHLAPLIG